MREAVNCCLSEEAMKIKLDKLRLMCNEIFDQLENKYGEIEMSHRTYWHIPAKKSVRLYKPEPTAFDVESAMSDIQGSILRYTKHKKIELEKLSFVLKAVANAIEKYE